MSVTDGTLNLGASAEETVRIVGTVTATPSGTQTVDGTVTANQGTAGTAAQGWFTKITDGTDTADVALPGANIGAGLVVTTGAIVATTTINALTAVGPGVVVDFGSGKINITMAHAATGGVSAGAVALEVSQDNINWFRSATDTLTASTVGEITLTGAWRYARGAITTTVTGGTVSATLMGA